MTDDEKKELLIALCAYYPYGVMVEVEGNHTGKLKGIDNGTVSTDKGSNYPLRLVKPYLREVMTGMEGVCYQQMLMCVLGDGSRNNAWGIEDWLNRKFIDYRKLISKGLALAAPEGMYNMAYEEKNDLLIALCSYYPYGVMVEVEGYGKSKLKGIDNGIVSTDKGTNYPLRMVKPYLRPMDSMNSMEILCYQNMSTYWFDEDKFQDAWDIEDWLNDSFLDYRDLISKGLALAAPEGMYNIEGL